MKARDIIHDWPRGTSTSKPWPSSFEIWWWPYLRNWSREDRLKLLHEQAMEKEYREAQARMMDDWHRARGATSVLAHGLFVGELSRPEPLNFEPTFAMLYPSRVMFKLEGFKQ